MPRGKPWQLICPNCKRKKDYRAEYCHKCRMELNPPRAGAGKGWVWTLGYKKVYIPVHPFSDAKGYVFEHRLIMEEYLKCHLDPRELLVHHINGIRDDNRLENLEVLTRGEHTMKHSTGRFKGWSWETINGKRVWYEPAI